jgi:hypothetical protein
VKTKGKLFISTPTTNFHYQKKENKFHRNKENEAIHEPQRIRIQIYICNESKDIQNSSPRIIIMLLFG